MKKVILFAAILFAGFSVIKAQGPTTSSNAYITLNLKGHQSIQVNAAQAQVVLNYETTESYMDGVNSGVLSDHLHIFSTSDFKVDVSATTLTSSTSETIEDGTIKVTAADGTTKKLDGASYTEVDLSTTAQTLITSDRGNNRFVNITYAAAGDDSYWDNVLSTDGTTTYTSTVTYTITPQ